MVIHLTIREHEASRPVGAEELRSVLDDAAYRRIEEHPVGTLFQQRVKDNAEPAFSAVKIATSDGFAVQVQGSYFVGIDWVFPGAVSVQVLPKVWDIDMPAMLKRALGTADSVKELDGLVTVRQSEKPIPEAEECDRFLLFVAAAFLQITRRIVRKGLLKSFRTEDETFRYRIKGKLCVSETLRKMRFGDPFARAVCSPQRFDADTPANRFLKFVLRRISALLSSRAKALGSAGRLLSGEAARLLRSFGEVSDLRTWSRGDAAPVVNPVFSEYVAALKLGRQFHLQEGIGAFQKSESEPRRIIPYWIDMTQLFELYVLADLHDNRWVRDVIYHRSFKPGGVPDYLVDLQGVGLPFECCVVDAKYKPRYAEQELGLNDARQLSGYGRLKSVISWMTQRGHSDRKYIVPCLVVYADPSSENERVDFTKLTPLTHWEDFWKIGIRLPQLPKESA